MSVPTLELQGKFAEPSVSQRGSAELNHCGLVPLILNLYYFRRMRRFLWKAVLRLERGQFYSATARQILERYYSVSVGAYSYGTGMTSGAFPPGETVGHTRRWGTFLRRSSRRRWSALRLGLRPSLRADQRPPVILCRLSSRLVHKTGAG